MPRPSSIEFAPASHEPEDRVLRKILSDFLKAKQLGAKHSLGKHWSFFREDFDRIIRTEAIWPRFREFAISYRFDDSCHYGSGRKDLNMLPSFTKTGTAHAWRFGGKAIQEQIQNFIDRDDQGLSRADLVALAETSIGTPPAVPIADYEMRLDWNDVSQVYFALRIEELFNTVSRPHAGRPIFLEIGGGYGALSAKLRKLIPDLRCIIIDLPEVSAVQHYYLSQADPTAVILGASDVESGVEIDLEKADYLLLPPEMSADLPPGVADIAANIRSFMEMPVAIVADYIRLVERVLHPTGAFYCANALEKRTSGDLVRLAEYPFDQNWTMDSHPVPLHWQSHIVALSLKRDLAGGDLSAVMHRLNQGVQSRSTEKVTATRPAE